MISASIIILLIGFILIAVYDILGAVLSRKLDFQYVWFSFGSFFLYGLIAFYLKGFGNITIALIGSFLIGVFDATVGLLIAEKFKANILKEDKEAVKITSKLVFSMGLLALSIGLITVLVF